MEENKHIPEEQNIASDEAIENQENAMSEIEKLQFEVAEQKEKYLRLFAEFDNYKRRTSKERLELMQTAGKEIITSLLTVLDDCDRAEKQINSSEEQSKDREGTLLVFNKLRSTLQQKGLRAMESIDTPFDVEKHEAITEVPVNDMAKQGFVIDELEKGYFLNDKLIRFAKVVVGK